MKGSLLFLGQTIRGWRTTGAFAPSGPAMSRAMADAVGDVAPGQVVIELGPGTGVITRELVRRFPRGRVVAVEVVDAFVPRLRREFPGVAVVHGCASELDAHLDRLGLAAADVAAVVSAVPLLVLPGELPQNILASITGVLRPGRRFVQLTYSTRKWRRFTVPGFRPLPARKVWLNIPPASVLSFERDAAPAAGAGVL